MTDLKLMCVQNVCLGTVKAHVCDKMCVCFYASLSVKETVCDRIYRLTRNLMSEISKKYVTNLKI